MSKKKTDTKFNLFLIVNYALAILTMVMVLILTGRMMNDDYTSVSLFLGLAILSEVGFQIMALFIHKTKRDKLRALLVGIIFIGATIVSFVSANNSVLFYISTFLVIFGMATNQLLLIGSDGSKRDDITHILLSITLIGLGVAILVNINKEEANYIALVTVILLLFNSLKKLVFPTFKIEKVRLLIDILVKTHTLDVLICLLAFIIAFSFIFPVVEPTITSFWDAMWYCFAVITTIGFGDFYATSLIGRVLTVILGIYGIVVVAILTSVIVNFYNEVSAKEKKRDIIDE